MTNALPAEGDKAPTAPKVIASTAGGGAGAAFGTLAVYVIGVFCPGGSFDASTVDKTLAAVPWPIAAVVPILLAAAGAYLSGHHAPHQARLEDVTEAMARYVVGDNELAPAAHDVAPEPEAAAPVGPPEDDEITDDDPGDVPVANEGNPA